MSSQVRNKAQLIVIEAPNSIKKFQLNSPQVKIGSACTDPNDVLINSRIVSRVHGIFTEFQGKYYYMDLESTNGTFINKRFIDRGNMSASAAVELNDGDIISIGSSVSNGKVYIIFSYCAEENLEWSIINLDLKRRITIGRDLSNDIVLPSVNVSRNHAVIEAGGAGCVISDLKSSNGTIVNGCFLMESKSFDDEDVATIGISKIIRVDNCIVYCVPKAVTRERIFNEQSGVEIDSHISGSENIVRKGGVEIRCENISKVVPCKKGTGNVGDSKKTILENVSLKINAGELVAILGGSGAGKTTFMNCINGFEPATSGKVYINGNELYSNYQAIKSSIGYVPQQDIVYDNLTLEAMLKYTGKLRLPSDITKEELDNLVTEVMKMVDLYPQKDTYIKKMSGGQRKRASIAVELVSDPLLFFLDEPTSGLDPEAETNLMHQLRGLATKKGKTVIVITHTLQNIDIFDKVVFLAPGGKLCFYGTPKDAMKFFEVDNLTYAYEKISKDIDGYVRKYNQLAGKEV